MSFQGDIRSLSLGDVIQNLTVNQKTGTLTIEDDGSRWRIRFRDGRIVSFADALQTTLLSQLIEKGVVPPDSRDRIVQHLGAGGNPSLGDVLEDMGLLDPETYREHLARYVKDALYDVLAIREGRFSFHSGEEESLPGERDVRALALELNPMSILIEAVRRTDDWQKIRRLLPSEDAVYAPVLADPEAGLAVDDEVSRKALELLDGTRTLRQVVSKLSCSSFEAWRSLARLAADGKIRPGSAPATEEDPAVALGHKAEAKRLEESLAGNPDDRGGLERLAALQDLLGHRKASAHCHRRLADLHASAGDLDGAERWLRLSLERDAAAAEAWRSARQLLLRRNDRDKLVTFLMDRVEHLRSEGDVDAAHRCLEDLAATFPGVTQFRVALAEILYEIGDAAAATRELEATGRYLLRQDRIEEAGDVYSRIVRHDPRNGEAQVLAEDIRSGQYAKKRIRKRWFVHNAILCSLFLTLCAHLAYELHVHGKLFSATKTVFAEGLLESGQHDEAIRRILAVQNSHPFSLTALYKTAPLLEAIREGQTHERSAASEPPLDPASVRTDAVEPRNGAQASRGKIDLR